LPIARPNCRLSACTVPALVWASVEEFVVTYDAPIEDDKSTIIKRWWPFEHHVIVYSPEIGWYADD
jgi:hypothetical protein